MSLEAILTVITVVLAVLALIPGERGQDLRIRLGGSAATVVILAAGLILYWSLLDPLHALPGFRRLPRFIPWLAGWGPASSSLAVFLGATGYSWWIYRRQVPPGRLPRLAIAVSDALARRRFPECTHLLEAHLGAIRGALEGNYWQIGLRKRFFPTFAELHLKALSEPTSGMGEISEENGESDSSHSEEPLSAIVIPTPKEPPGLVKRFSSWAERPRDTAHDIVRSVSLSPQAVRHIAATNPYLGLSLSLLPSSWVAREFSETFAQALISDPESVLYRELRRAENVDLHNVPLVDRVEQPLLAALCDDSLRPDGPQLLYTYLEAGIDPVRGYPDQSLSQELNRPIGEFFERGRWFSPPFSTIYLLEITAPRNAVSAEAHLINLFVLSSLTDALLQQLSPSDDVDLSREWPTPTHYLLYECVSLLVDIVRIWQKRPADLPASRLAEERDGLPYVLPAHAIDVLGSVMRAVLRSSKLEPGFKGYLLEVWWRAYWEKYTPPWPNSDTVLSSLVRGGHFHRAETDHRDGVAEALRHVDVMRQVSEGGDKIRAAFGLPDR